MLKRMDSEFLMALEDNQIVSVALMIPEEEILAMDRVDLLPVLECKFNSRKRRMSMKFIAQPLFLEELQNLGDSMILHYLLRLLA